MAGGYRSVIIGASGGRARHHALAYRHQRRAKLVAVSARTVDKRDELADAYGVAARYDDYREMLARERPDVVHVNTPPDARLELLEQIAAAGVPSAIIEKPIAIDGPDCAALAGVCAQTSPLKVAVNHQLHYHAPRRRLQRLVADGAIGAVRFIDASTGMNAAYQGTHALQSVFAFAGGAQPAAVFGQASGNGRPAAISSQPLRPRRPAGGDRLRRRPARRAALRWPARPRLTEAPPEAREAVWGHKRITVYGERGHVTWTMWSWETLLDGRHEGGEHDYWEHDAPAESALVRLNAGLDRGSAPSLPRYETRTRWAGTRRQPKHRHPVPAGSSCRIRGPKPDHPLALAEATAQYAVLLAVYRSATERRPLALQQSDGRGPGQSTRLRAALSPPAAPVVSPPAGALIDADVHIATPTVETLYPYLDARWVEHFSQTLDSGASQHYYPKGRRTPVRRMPAPACSGCAPTCSTAPRWRPRSPAACTQWTACTTPTWRRRWPGAVNDWLTREWLAAGAAAARVGGGADPDSGAGGGRDRARRRTGRLRPGADPGAHRASPGRAWLDSTRCGSASNATAW